MSLDAFVHEAQRWCAVSGAGALVLGVVALVVDRCTGGRRPALVATLWWAVVVRLLLPADAGSPFGVRLPESAHSALVSSVGSYDLYGHFGAHGFGALAAGLWASGALLLLALVVHRLVAERRAWRRVVRRAPAVSTLVLYHDVAARLGVRARATLVVCADAGPAVVGLWRPRVVLPAALEHDDRSVLESVLAHELSHLARRDGWRRLAALLVCAVLWFHPAAWWSARRLAALAELDCDRRAARVAQGGAQACRAALLGEVRRWPLLDAAAQHVVARAFVHPGALVLERLRALERAPSGDRRRAGPLLAAALFAVPLTTFAPAWPAPLVVPPLESLSGCVQQRHAVMALYARALAAQQHVEPPVDPGPDRTHGPLPSNSTSDVSR